MYNAAWALLLTKDISPKTHRGLIAKFGEEFMKMEGEAKDMLENKLNNKHMYSISG